MTVSVPCRACATPLPEGASYCPKCGARTPTQISDESAIPATSVDATALAEQRERLQRAVGEAYAVEHLIGSGGFAQVWAATDRKLRRRVAIKVLHADLSASRAIAERFQREAQAVAQLRHPGIIPIYGVGGGEEAVFYVMPLVHGETIRERLRREGRLSPDETRRVLREAAAAVAVAHRAGLVHRDLKPENLMLEGEERRLLVMDFGIAKSVQAAETGLTGTGMIIGTPQYMSPEQASGEKAIDARSDIYSLGVVAFEMLVGRPPFSGGSAAELVMHHVSTPAPSLASELADAPEDLVIAVNRCLAKPPQERWANAGELAAFLERTATPAPGAAAFPPELRRFGRRGWRPSRRQLRIAGPVATATILIALGLWQPETLQDAGKFWRGVLGLGRTAEVGTTRATVTRGSFIMLGMGEDRLAVLNPDNWLLGVNTYDGRSWQSFLTHRGNYARPFAVSAGGTVLFGGDAMYRLTPSGVVREGNLPFPSSEAWSDGREVLVYGGSGDLAWRSGRGWRRDPTALPGPISDIVGLRRDDLVGLSLVPGEGNNIVEYDGIRWVRRDPHPAQNLRWYFYATALMRDGTPVVVGNECQGEAGAGAGAGACSQLVLSRSPSRTWQRLTVAGDTSLAGFRAGVWSASRDLILTWRCCDEQLLSLAETTPAGSRLVEEIGPGVVTGAAALRGVPHVLKSDGTLWARQRDRWVYAGEVPGTARAQWSTWTDGKYLAWGESGSGLLVGQFSGDSVLPNRDLTLDAALGPDLTGVAVGRHEAWLLSANGSVTYADCRRSGPCVTSPVTGLPSPLTGLAQRPGGGAIGIGPGALIVATDGRGEWRRLSLPASAAPAPESLVAVHSEPNSMVAVLGTQNVYVIGRDHNLRLVARLPEDLAGTRLVAARASGDVVVAGDESVWLLNGARRSLLLEVPSGSRVTAMAVLPDGEIAIGYGGDADDPLSTGGVLVVNQDGSAKRLELSDRLRTRVTSLHVGSGRQLVAHFPSGRAVWGLPIP